MAQEIIDLGTTADDGTGDSLRVGGEKINDNFTELYAQVSANKYASFVIGDVGTGATVGDTYTPSTSDFSLVELTSESSGMEFTITLASAMQSTTYLVKCFIESVTGFSSSTYPMIFKIVSTTQFIVKIKEEFVSTQDYKIHVEVIQK